MKPILSLQKGVYRDLHLLTREIASGSANLEYDAICSVDPHPMTHISGGENALGGKQRIRLFSLSPPSIPPFASVQ